MALLLSDEGPPNIEEEKEPGCDGRGISFPICFARSHTVLVDFADREFARWTDACINGHILHAFGTFFRNMATSIG